MTAFLLFIVFGFRENVKLIQLEFVFEINFDKRMYFSIKIF